MIKGKLKQVLQLFLVVAVSGFISFSSTIAISNPVLAQDSSDTSSSEDESAEDEELGCQGGVLGWILCPVINTMADVIRVTAGVVDSLMQYRLLATASTDANTDGTQEGVQSNVSPSTIMRAAWQNFLNIANILLVVAFLAIIFSQATSVGVSNYGIKRMLPRVIAGAIIMNLSFYICAFLIDITNILGNSILGLFQGMSSISGDPSIQGAMDQLSGPNGLGQSIAGGVLVVAAAVAIVAFFLVPVLLGILLVFVILVARQVILTVLVLVSPLAFVAWLLPNTEQYFKKWWSLFTQMLLAYPIVMAVFGASMFVASIIQAVNAVEDGSIGGALDVVLPLVVLTIPLFLLPKIIMSTNSMLGKVGGAMKQVYGATGLTALGKKQREGVWRQTGAKAADNIGYRARSSRLGRNLTDRSLRDKKMREGRRTGLEKNAEKRYEDFIHNADTVDDTGGKARKHLEKVSGGDEKAMQGYMDQAAAAVNKRQEDAVKEAIAGIQNNPEYMGQAGGKAKAEHLGEVLKGAMADNDTVRAAAATSMLMQQGSPGVGEISNITSTGGDSEMHQALASALGEHYETLESKAPETLEFVNSNGTKGSNEVSATTWKKVTANNIENLSEDSLKKALQYGASGAISKNIVETALNDPRISARLTDAHKEIMNRHKSRLT